MAALSQAVEDYLKAIYELSRNDPNRRVGTTKLAAKLGFSGASVTGMLQKLAQSQPSLVEYKRYRGVRLTAVGLEVALEVVRHHRLVEAYLAEALGYSWDEVHDEADQLEHVISESFEKRIAEYLGHPRVDPHGDPIPDPDGKIQATSETSLDALEVGGQGTITRVTDETALLRLLDELQLSIGSQIVVHATDDEELVLRLPDGDSELVLPRASARHVFVSSQA